MDSTQQQQQDSSPSSSALPKVPGTAGKLAYSSSAFASAGHNQENDNTRTPTLLPNPIIFGDASSHHHHNPHTSSTANTSAPSSTDESVVERNTRANSRDGAALHRTPVEAEEVKAVNPDGYNTGLMDLTGNSVFLPAKDGVVAAEGGAGAGGRGTQQ